MVNILRAQQGDVEIIKDSRIDALVSRQGAVTPPAVRPQIDGYRIQLFFDPSRDALNAARGQFIARYPKIDTYTQFRAPHFFLRVGDFRTRLEAEGLKVEIEAEFPTSFIIKEKIFLPRLNIDASEN
jgi:hypothetical protein